MSRSVTHHTSPPHHSQDPHTSPPHHSQDLHTSPPHHSQDPHTSPPHHSQDPHTSPPHHSQDTHTSPPHHSQDPHTSPPHHSQDTHTSPPHHSQDLHTLLHQYDSQNLQVQLSASQDPCTPYHASENRHTQTHGNSQYCRTLHLHTKLNNYKQTYEYQYNQTPPHASEKSHTKFHDSQNCHAKTHASSEPFSPPHAFLVSQEQPASPSTYHDSAPPDHHTPPHTFQEHSKHVSVSPSLDTSLYAFPDYSTKHCASPKHSTPPYASPEPSAPLSGSSEHFTSPYAFPENSSPLFAYPESSTAHYTSPERLRTQASVRAIALNTTLLQETGSSFMVEECGDDACGSVVEIGGGWNVSQGEAGSSGDEESYHGPCVYPGRPLTRQRSHTYCGFELVHPHGRIREESWWHARVRRGSGSSISSDDLTGESVSGTLSSSDHCRSLSQGLPGDDSKDSRGCTGLRRALSSFSLRLLQREKVRPAQQRILRPPRRRQTIRGLSGLTIDAANQWTSTAPTDG